MAAELEIETLRKKLAEAEKAEMQKAKEAFDALPRELTWEIEWHNEFVFSARCWMSKQTKQAIADYKALYPRGHIPMDMDRVNSMQYALIGNMLLSAGGGCCVLKASPDNHVNRYPHPRRLTVEEIECLRRGEVPNSLKQWGNN